MSEETTYPCPNCDNGVLHLPNGKDVPCGRCGGTGVLTIKKKGGK